MQIPSSRPLSCKTWIEPAAPQFGHRSSSSVTVGFFAPQLPDRLGTTARFSHTVLG